MTHSTEKPCSVVLLIRITVVDNDQKTSSHGSKQSALEVEPILMGTKKVQIFRDGHVCAEQNFLSETDKISSGREAF